MATVPTSELTIKTERAREKTREDIKEAELSVRALIDIFSAGTCPQITERLASFNVDHLQRPRFDRHRTKTARFLDGFVIIQTTREGDTDRAHQLTVTHDDGVVDVSYYRTAADIQYRSQSGEDVRLNGIEAIASEKIALNSLSLLVSSAAAMAEQGWPGTCRLSELALVRRPVAGAA